MSSATKGDARRSATATALFRRQLRVAWVYNGHGGFAAVVDLVNEPWRLHHVLRQLLKHLTHTNVLLCTRFEKWDTVCVRQPLPRFFINDLAYQCLQVFREPFSQ
jgi:hypothetical protein